MSRPKVLVDEELVAQAQTELASLREGRVCIRLMAIVACGSQAEVTVAQVFGVSRETVRQWLRRFRAQGVAGLEDRPRGHNPRKLSPEQCAQVAQWLESGTDSDAKPVHWTLKRLAAHIEKVFGVRMGHTPLWLLVRAMEFTIKVPRPRHIGADAQAQEEFKKKRQPK